MTLYKINSEDNHEGFFLKQNRKKGSPVYTFCLIFPVITMSDQRKKLTVENSTVNKRMALESKRYTFEYHFYHVLAGWQ